MNNSRNPTGDDWSEQPENMDEVGLHGASSQVWYLRGSLWIMSSACCCSKIFSWAELKLSLAPNASIDDIICKPSRKPLLLRLNLWTNPILTEQLNALHRFRRDAHRSFTFARQFSRDCDRDLLCEKSEPAGLGEFNASSTCRVFSRLLSTRLASRAFLMNEIWKWKRRK